MRRLITVFFIVFFLTSCVNHGIDDPEDGIIDRINDPVITLIGEEEITIEVGSVFEDPGATAWYDGSNVTVDITSDLNTDELGIYIIHYNCTVNDQHATELTRTITVVDTTPPIVTLELDQQFILEFGDELDSSFITVSDNYDAQDDIVVYLNRDDLLSLGDIELSIYATDQSGNQSEVQTIMVKVQDTTGPVLAFSEYDNFEHEQGVPYSHERLLVSDNSDSYENITIHHIGEVDVNTIGEYEVSYYATDSYGNVGQTITKTVQVIERTTEEDYFRSYMKEHTAFYNPFKFRNNYTYDVMEWVYRGVVIENGEYQAKYYFFLHNEIDGVHQLSRIDFVCPNGNNFEYPLMDEQVDYVFDMPLECMHNDYITIITYVHEENPLNPPGGKWEYFMTIGEENLEASTILGVIKQGDLK